jgi:glycosyltransferase involved in cell wall biosynthesis
MSPRVLMGLMFFPRGGSAHVARNLATALPAAGWDASIVSGSLALPGRPGDARAFYRDLDVHPVDFTAALDAPDPLLADPPFHPSFEERADAPDRVFASLGDDVAEHLVDAWARELAAAGAAEADVLHLHHLTPLNEAAARVAPDVPVVGHLHGTELLMLEAIEANPGRWAHGAAWTERMRRWAERAERLIVLSKSQDARAERLLGVPHEQCVEVNNGFDPQRFQPREVDRGAHWAEYVPALAGYEGPVLLYVGRFTEVKRVPLLIEAYEAARERFGERAPLVLVGGFPDEFEGEHPDEAIARTGAQDVHLAGWHEHDVLPSFINAADVIVLPSVAEQFGQVLVEGMACARPVIAVNSHGPAEIVDAGETGWLVGPDDRDALANALIEAVNDPDERRRRGANARQAALDRYAWPALAERVAAVYQIALGRR